MLVEAAFVLGVAGLLLYGILRMAGAARPRQLAAAQTGEWRVGHYDVHGVTRVVVQKVSPGGTHKLDEHVVAALRIDEPDYDTRFLEAMAAARERRALFEAEEG